VHGTYLVLEYCSSAVTRRAAGGEQHEALEGEPDPSSVGAFTPHFLYRQELIGARRHYVRVWTLLDSAMRLPKRCVRQC
jgi:hypothetical protein